MILRQVLSSTKIGQLTIKSVPTLNTQETVAEAANQMRSHSHGSALVCEESGKLTGVITERDLLRLISTGKSLQTPLGSVMTGHPQTVTLDDELLKVIQLMDQGNYRRLPVVDAKGLPVGIIDVKTVVHFLVEHFPSAVYNQASTAQQTAKNREGA